MSFNFLSKYKLVISIIGTVAIIALVYFICSYYKNNPKKEEGSMERYRAISYLAADTVNLCVFINREKDNIAKMKTSVFQVGNRETKEYFESIEKNWKIEEQFKDSPLLRVQTNIQDLVLKDKTLTGSIAKIGNITVTMNKNKREVCLILGCISGKFHISSKGLINYDNKLN